MATRFNANTEPLLLANNNEDTLLEVRDALDNVAGRLAKALTIDTFVRDLYIDLNEARLDNHDGFQLLLGVLRQRAFDSIELAYARHPLRVEQLGHMMQSIQNNPSCPRCVLHNCRILPRDLQHLPTNCRISSVSVSMNIEDHAAREQAIQSLGLNTHLTSLELQYLNAATLKLFFVGLQTSCSIRNIMVSPGPPLRSSVEVIFSLSSLFEARPSNLVAATLDGVAWTEELMLRVKHALEINTQLRSLRFLGNAFVDQESRSAFVDMLSLDIAQRVVTIDDRVEDNAGVFQKLAAAPTGIQTLNFHLTSRSPACFKAVLSGLASPTSGLSGLQATCSRAFPLAGLAEFLPSITTLSELKIKAPLVAADGRQALMKALLLNRSLTLVQLPGPYPEELGRVLRWCQHRNAELPALVVFHATLSTTQSLLPKLFSLSDASLIMRGLMGLDCSK